MATPTAAGQAILDTFGIVRIVSLPDRTDRRREIAAQFGRLGLSIDGGRVGFVDGRRFTDAAGFPTVGTRGCFAAHVAVLELAAASGAPSVLLMEDDVDWSATVERDLPRAFDALAGHDWSLCYGGFLDRGVAWRAPAGAGPHIEIADPAEPILGGHCIAFSRRAATLAAPFLNAMAERAPGSAEGGPMHVDGAYGWFRRAHPDLLTAIVVPPLCHQRSSRTDIHALGLGDRLPALAPFMRAARRIKRWLPRPHHG